MVRASSTHLHPARNILDIQLANSLLPPSATFSSSTSTLSIPPLRLTPKDNSTRVQLQRQRLEEQHPLSYEAIASVPGFKTSATFFDSLRTNLRLHASPPPSPISTPPSMRGSTTSLPPPSPLSTAMDANDSTTEAPRPEDPLSGVPELNTYLATEEDDKIDALKLTADSIAQMRQAANGALIYHPVNASVVVALLALIARYMHEEKYEWAIVGCTVAGLLMCGLAISRWLTQDYLFAAEAINWDWLGDADVLVTKFGDEVIGTVVIEWVSGESRQKKRKAWRGEIKAWTVRLKYRGKGVGSALLEEAVKEAKKKGAESLEFDEEHANSKRVLYDLYNSKFDQRERTSRDLLQELFETSPVRGKKK